MSTTDAVNVILATISPNWRKPWPSPASWQATRGAIRRSYANDLRLFSAWCDQANLRLFTAPRAYLELFGRWIGRAGPLADPGSEPGEQVAAMDLFAGAIGLFKNPSSHRYVDFDDATLAGEIIVLADLLIRLLDKRPEAGAQPAP